jgi:protein-S-isoprenylcysteine O-methyltransferase Ste14
MNTHETQPAPEPWRSRWLLIPPPPLFVGSFVAGVQAHRVVPLPLVPASIQAAARTGGVGLVGLAVLLLAAAPALFLHHRTTIVPHRKARSLITAGPYRITRNPMYVGLTLAYVGVALTMNLVWPLLFLMLPLWVLHNKIIPFEEATLARIFGVEYRAFRQRVRRWI